MIKLIILIKIILLFIVLFISIFFYLPSTNAVLFSTTFFDEGDKEEYLARLRNKLGDTNFKKELGIILQKKENINNVLLPIINYTEIYNYDDVEVNKKVCISCKYILSLQIDTNYTNYKTKKLIKKCTNIVQKY